MQFKFLATATLGMLIALQLPFLAHAGPAEDAQVAFSRFFPAFVARNQAEVAAMFAPDGQFYGTLLIGPHRVVRLEC
jgi:hypothetical protein